MVTTGRCKGCYIFIYEEVINFYNVFLHAHYQCAGVEDVDVTFTISTLRDAVGQRKVILLFSLPQIDCAAVKRLALFI